MGDFSAGGSLRPGSLQLLVYELSPPRFRNRGKTQFPIFTDESEFKVLARHHIRGIEGDERTLIERVQPYHARDPALDPLAVLSRLANTDKHRLLLSTAAATAELDTWIATTNAEIQIRHFIAGPVGHATKIMAFTATPEDPAEQMYVQPNSALEIRPLRYSSRTPASSPVRPTSRSARSSTISSTTSSTQS